MRRGKRRGRNVRRNNEPGFEGMSAADMEKYRASPETVLSILTCNRAMSKTMYREMIENRPSYVDINEKDGRGMTALYFAVSVGEAERVKILLENGADPSIRETAFEMTPLFHATGRYPNPEIATLLLEYGACVNHKSTAGATALHGACLQGNKECMRVLIKHGADPRMMSDDGTTPLDLAKDDETREILHKKNRHNDEKLDKIDEACKVCNKTEDEPGIKLMRCSACHAVWYCSRECQKKDWKENGHKISCEGFITVHAGETPWGMRIWTTSKQRMFAMKRPNVKIDWVEPGEKERKPATALKNKRFVVKIQIPLDSGQGSLMVYNEDKSVHFFITSDAHGYFTLMRKIREEGFLGAKGYFWAERKQEDDGGMKIFHAKMAPFQRW